MNRESLHRLKYFVNLRIPASYLKFKFDLAGVSVNIYNVAHIFIKENRFFLRA